MAFFQSVISLHMSVLTGVFGSTGYQELSSLRDTSPDVDRGWAFVVVVFSFLGHILIYGPSWSFGILYIRFLEEFEELPSVTAWIGTISAALTLLGGPFGSIIINRFGNRTAIVVGCLVSTLGLVLSYWATGVHYLYLTFGVLAGLGWSIGYIPFINILGDYFNKYRKIAIGCGSAGVGMGLFIYPPLFTLLLDTYEWRGTMLIIAGLNLNMLLAAAVFMAPRLSPRGELERDLLMEEQRRKAQLKDKVTSSVLSIEREAKVPVSVYLREIFQIEVFQNPHYICLAMNNAFISFCISIIFTHLSNLAKFHEYHSYYCSALISAIGAPNVIGRLSLGFVIQHPKVNVIFAYIICFSIVGISTLPVAFLSAYPALVTFAVVFGFTSAAFGTVTPEVVIYICGLRRLASAYGYILAFEAVGMLIGGPAAGWVLESTNQYDGCFIMAGCAGILSALIMIPSWWRLSRYRSMADSGPPNEEEAIQP